MDTETVVELTVLDFFSLMTAIISSSDIRYPTPQDALARAKEIYDCVIEDAVHVESIAETAAESATEQFYGH